MINSFFLWLSRGLFAIFLSLFLILLSTLSRVPSVQLLFSGVRPYFDQSGHRLRRQILQPPPFLPPPLLLPQVVVWLSRPLWRSFSALMLALTLSVMSCVRWTPVSIIFLSLSHVLYFCFTLRCFDEFCLKCFIKIGCQNLLCHELFSCKVFQDFVLGLDFIVFNKWWV